MRRLTCNLVWFMFSASPALLGEIPQVYYLPGAPTSSPTWIAAERVLTPSGEIDPSLFDRADQRILRGYLQGPVREGCIHLGRVQVGGEVGPERTDRQNLASMAKSAGWVFQATVTARAPGFNGTNPGTLLEVVPEETLKGPHDRGGAHYVFVPVGTFSLGGKKICKTDDDYAALPEVGERVLLFVDLNWLNRGPFLWPGNDTGIVTIKKDGRTSLPKRYLKTDSPLEGAEEGELMRFIRNSVEREN